MKTEVKDRGVRLVGVAKKQWQADMEAAKVKLDYYNNLKAVNAEATRSEMREAVETVELQATNEMQEADLEKGEKGEVTDAPSLLDVVKTLYSKGKEVASKLFQRSFFDVAKTPKFMQELGLRGEKFTIKYGVIARHLGKDSSHTLTEKDWEQLPQALQNPFAISKLTDKKDSYRIYTTLQTESGEFVVVGADVKNAGREIEVNAVSTVFGRRNNANLPKNEEVIYRSKEITPEQSSLLERPNFAQYPTEQELSTDEGTTQSAKVQENTQKSGEDELDIYLAEIKAFQERMKAFAQKSPSPGSFVEAYIANNAELIKRLDKQFNDALQTLVPLDIPAIEATIKGMKDNKRIIKAGSANERKETPAYKAFDHIEKALAKRKKQLEKQLTEDDKRRLDIIKRGNSGELKETAQPKQENKPVESEPIKDEAPGQSGVQQNESGTHPVADEVLAMAKKKQQARLADHAKGVAEKLGVEVTVHNDESTVTNRDAMKAITEGGEVKGWYNPNTGEIALFMPNMESMRDVESTILHEAVSHYGIKHFLGKEDFDKFLDGVWDMMPASKRAEFLQYVGADMKNPSLAKMRQAADEYVAHIAEKMDLNELERSVWQRFIDYVMNVLRKAGFKNLKQRDVEAVIRASYANLRQNGGNSQVTGRGETMARKKSGRNEGTMFRISKTPQEFDATQKEAVEKRGIVAPNLNSAVVNVVDVPKHDFTGSLKEARAQAEDWAVKNYTGREFDFPDNSGKYVISKKAIGKYLDKTAVEKSDNAAVHLSALKKLPEIISNSIEVELHADYKKDGQGRSGKEIDRDDLLIHRLYGAINIGGNTYRVKTTIREFKDVNTPNSPHSYEVTKIELIEDSTVTPDGIDSPLNRPINSISATKLLNGVEKSYDKGKFVLDESEKSSAEEENRTRFRRANKNQEVFVSNAQRAVEGIKQEKATPEQWIAMLKKNGGLKAGEEAWLGLEEWLEERAKSKDERGKEISLTKQEVLDFIGANKIQIEEVEYESNPQSFEDLKEEYEAMLRDEGYDAAHDAMVDRFGDDFDIAFEDLGGELAIANEEAAATLLGSGNIINSTRLDYTTEGLKNKREIALTVPTIEPYNESDEVHFSDAGNGRAVAWVRFGETTDSEGNRVLVIDEIQSKRHQDGREKGYKSQADKTPATMEELTFGEYNGLTTVSLRGERFFFKSSTSKDEILDIINKRIADGQLGAANSLVPDAPFEKNWHELAMKRMLRLAAEEGFDKVAWTTGEQQAERYNMRKQVGSIEVRRDNGEYNVFTYNTHGDLIYEATATMTPEQITETFGKELGGKILAVESGKRETITGENLSFGGEGMKGFYDKMLPSFVSKYTKKWGAKVGEVTMPNLGENNTMHSVDVTPEMKESVMEGQTMFSKRMPDKDAPIKEHTRTWAERCQEENPKLWNEVVDALKVLPEWGDAVDADARAMELLESLCERENYSRVEKEMKTGIERANGVFEMAERISSWAKVKAALKSFWNWVQRNVFHTEPMDWQDFVDDVVGRYYGVSKVQRLQERIGSLARDVLNAVFKQSGIDIELAEPTSVEQVAVSLSSVGEPTAPLGQRSSAESGELNQRSTPEGAKVKGENQVESESQASQRNRNMDREAWKKAFKKGGEKAYDLMYELHGGIVSTFPDEFLNYLKEVIGVPSDVANIVEAAHDYLVDDFKKKNPELFKRNEGEKVEDVHSLLATKGYSLLEHTMDNGKAIGVKMMYRDKFVPSGKTDAGYTPETEWQGRTVICYYNHPEDNIRRQYVFTVTKDNAMETPTAYELVADPSLMTAEWAEYLEKTGRKNADGTFFLDGLVPNFNDPFSLSHLMIRVNKNSHDIETISRYNHGAFNERGEYERIAGQPNATLGNNLDKLVEGLSESLMEYKQLETLGTVPLGENMVKANDGKVYRYNTIKGGVYFGDGFWVDRRGEAHVINPGKEKLVGEFLYGGGKVQNVTNGESVDVHGLKFTENGVEFYTGGEEVTETREIEIKGEKKTVTKKVIKGDAKNVITFDGDKTRLETESADAETIGRVGKLYDVYSIKGDNLTEAGNGFLEDFFWVRMIDFPNLEKVGDNCFNATLTEAYLPKLREVGVNCFNRVSGVNVPLLPSLEKVGANFMYSVGMMGEDVNIDFPKLREVGNFFMANAQPSVVSLPSLETCGEGFMKGCMRGVTVDLPNLTKAGWEFFGGGFSVQSLNAPKLTDVKNDFMEGNQEIRQQILEQTGKEFVEIEDVERIDVEDSAYELKDGTVVDAKRVSVKFPEGVTFMVVDTNGNVLAGVFAGKKLAEVVGKQYAAEILKPGSFTIEAKEETNLNREGAGPITDREVVMESEETMFRMGSRVDARMAELASHFDGKELSTEQRAVADVFGGKADNLTISVKTQDGNTRNVEMRQGNDLAGAKHSLYAHYGTTKGVINADDLLLIPEVIANGERTENGKKAVYKLDVNGTKYTVVTYVKQNKEEFHNFYSNKKGQPSQSVNASIGDTHSARITEELASADKGSTSFAEMQEGETLFRRAEQDSEEARQKIESLDNEVLATIEELAQELYSNVGIITDIESIPDEKKRKDAKRGMKGWYDPATGVVAVVLPNIADKQDAVETMLHEIVGHKGLRGLLGEKYNEFLNEVFVNAPKEMRADIMKIVMAQKADGSRTPLRTAVEEYLAGIAEGGFANNPTLWTKIMTALKQLLRSMGVKVDVSENELAYMLWRSHQLLKGGYDLESRIIDSVMKQRMEVGEYRRRRTAFHGPMRSQGRNLAKEIELFGLRDEYEKMILSTGFQSREAFQDSMFALKKFQEMLEKATGKKLPDYFNAYYMENALSSANQAQAEAYGRLFYKKIVDEVNALKEVFEQEEIFDYLIIKHGIERNREMAVRSVLSSEENGLDRKMYNKYVAKKKEILKNAKENKLSWEETQRELDELAVRFGADLSKDYSGLSAIFSKVKGKGKTER